MLFSAKTIGVAVGLTAAAAVLWLMPTPAQMPCRTGPLLSECDGAIRTLVIQYTSEARFTLGVYRDFLSQLPPDVRVFVMCPDRAAFDELSGAVGPTACALKPVLTGHAMTCWSRDRWLAMRSHTPGDSTTLITPREEQGSEAWPARAGDQRVAFDLANHPDAGVAARRSSLCFDGGDLMADNRSVFVVSEVIRRNLQITISDVPQLRERLAELTGREVILLENSPEHHAGMFMAVVGDRTVLVGDPSLARGESHPELPGGADSSSRTQEQFDSVARQTQQAGYRIVRIPVVPAADRKTYITYVNGIIDQRDGKRIVYLPQYRGAESLNASAESIWRGLGYEVRKVDCTETYSHFGNLHCLVNVLERS